MNKYIDLDIVKETEKQERKERYLMQNKRIKLGMFFRYLLLLIGVFIIFVGINPVISLPFFAPSVIALIIRIFFLLIL